jgi:hypothetical protein
MPGEMPGAEAGLAARLLAPAHRVTLEDLPGVWFHTVATVRCHGAGPLAREPRFTGKLRGAWGEQLKAAASAEAIAGGPCPWQPPCALDVLFRPQARITPALEVPKPYVLAAMAEGGDLVVRLTLFGLATEWTEAAVEALVRACRTLVQRNRTLEVVGRRFWSEEQIAVPEPVDALVLAFETPLEIRERRRQEPQDEAGEARDEAAKRGEGGGKDVDIRGDGNDMGGEAFDFPRFVATLGNRVSGLARWQDAGLDGDFRALKNQAAAVAVQVQPRREQRWTRFSGRQERWIPMGGRRPVVLLEGRLGPLLPLLALGETCHAGSHASLGLGRYRLLVPE